MAIQFTAPADGFLIASISCEDGERGILTVSVDGKTYRASAHHYGASDAWVRWNTLTIPMKKGVAASIDIPNDDKNGQPEINTEFVNW